MRFLRFVPMAAGLGFAAAVGAQTVNINTANQSQLAQPGGIGPKKAQAIIRYRRAHGPFKLVDSITGVKGIGPKTLAHDRAAMTVGAKTACKGASRSAGQS